MRGGAGAGRSAVLMALALWPCAGARAQVPTPMSVPGDNLDRKPPDGPPASGAAPSPGAPPPGPAAKDGRPPPPPPLYIPPWFEPFKKPVEWKWGRFGYDLSHVKGLWRGGEQWPVDRGLHVAIGPDDRFLLIVNFQLALRYSLVHNGGDMRGHSYSIERMLVNLRGNFMTPRLVYMVNVLALTALGSSPFLLDMLIAYAIWPRRIALLAGQFLSDVIPQATTPSIHMQMADRSIASRFFFVDRALGAQLVITPLPRPDRTGQLTVTLGFWNHHLEQNPLAFNNFNPDLGFMTALGLDYTRGPTYGVREGDFNHSPVPRFRIAARGLYSSVDRLLVPGAPALRGRIFFSNLYVGAKYKGFGVFGNGLVRLSQFIDRDPDLLDFGVTVQVSQFVVRHTLELSVRYSQIWPDVFQRPGEHPRNLPRTSDFQQPFDVFEPLIPASKIEIGGALRYYPTKDPMWNLIVAYLYRDVDSMFLLQVNGWI